MTRYFAFLRGVNVGGRNVAMAELRQILTQAGLKQVETFIASGNVVFESTANSPAALERKIERQLLKALGYPVRTFLRTEAELVAVTRNKPFPAAALRAATVLSVGFLGEALDGPSTKTLLSFRSDVDDFHVEGREMYWVCRVKQSDSPFFKVPIERRLGRPITFRNARTLSRLAAKYCGTDNE